MKMKIRAILLVFALWMFFLPSQSFANPAVQLKRADFPVVLMYHDIKLKEVNGFDVSVLDFQKQLDWLQANGYQTLSMDEFTKCLQQGDFPAKSVLITFDDGYQGVYTYAVPELRQRSMKASFFIIKDAIGSALPQYPYMTMDEIKKISADPLFAIEPHTLSHPDLRQLTGSSLQEELAGAKAYFEIITGKPCDTMAFPYGYYDEHVLQAVQQAGYKAAFAVSDRGFFGADASFSIPRIYMGNALGKNDMKLFKKYVKDYHNMPPAAFAERFGPVQ